VSRIRITCKSPAPVERREFVPGYPVIVSTPASWTDTEVLLVADDGTEHAITNISAIRWSAQQGTELPVATLEFFDVDLDVDVEVTFPKEWSGEGAMCPDCARIESEGHATWCRTAARNAGVTP
jgi:hypothetical protein